MAISKTPPHPLVIDLRKAMDAQRCTFEKLVADSGIGRGTLSGWFYLGTNPVVTVLDRALAPLGLRLGFVPIESDQEGRGQ